jgi:hypothetical protein
MDEINDKTNSENQNKELFSDTVTPNDNFVKALISAGAVCLAGVFFLTIAGIKGGLPMAGVALLTIWVFRSVRSSGEVEQNE